LWCAAGALTVVSAALFRRQIAVLSAANPAARLPWIGWPAKIPGSARALGGFATLLAIFSVDCVFEALGRRHLYDILWGLPLALFALAMAVVRQAQHNRRVRRAP
jgi:hypothetical protein